MNAPLFPYSDTNKRYHTYDFYVKRVFGRKCAKIGLNGGFTCPNRDGWKGVGGCTFCADGGGESENGGLSLHEQYERGRERVLKKWGKTPAIPYFQFYTSTYAPLPRLRSLFEEALHFEDAVGLTVATRADALPKDVLDYLKDLSQRTVLTVELGLQSMFDQTARRINRGHTFSEFLRAYEELKIRDISVCVHLIDGLPGENRDMMLRSAETVGALKPDFMKIHALYLRKGSALCDEYLRRPFRLLEAGEYVEILADQIERIPPETVIERLTGDPVRSQLVAPLWVSDKKKILAALDRTLEQRNSYQGIRLSNPETATGFPASNIEY